MSTSFSARDMKQMSEWIGVKKDYRLLFKATRDGCCSQTFHAKCDNQGPTVTICYNTDNCVFGGYNPVSWNSTRQWTTHNDAFLFRLNIQNTFPPKKYPLNPNNANGMYNDQTYGPIFGGGHDLYTFSNTINKTGTYFQGNGVANFGTSYNMSGDAAAQITNNNLKYLDIEVYLVTDIPVELEESIPEVPLPKVYDVPWRKVSDVSSKTLKTNLDKYAPVEGLENQFVNILLIGQVGAGKSSFFNTVNSILKGRLTSKARSGTAEQSLTTTFRMYKIKSGTSGLPMKFRFCDTRGLEEGHSLDLLDLVALMDGHIGDGYMFTPSNSITPESPKYNKNPTINDRMHCIAFVVDSSTVDVFPKKHVQTWKSLQQKANQRGIPQVVLLTKVHKVCSEVNKDAGMIYYSKAVAECVEKASQLMALPRSHVFPIKNYENEDDLDEKIDIACLLSIKHMLEFSDDYLEDYLDQHR